VTAEHDERELYDALDRLFDEAACGSLGRRKVGILHPLAVRAGRGPRRPSASSEEFDVRSDGVAEPNEQ
jgi:hypothetical protein